MDWRFSPIITYNNNKTLVEKNSPSSPIDSNLIKAKFGPSLVFYPDQSKSGSALDMTRSANHRRHSAII